MFVCLFVVVVVLDVLRIEKGKKSNETEELNLSIRKHKLITG